MNAQEVRQLLDELGQVAEERGLEALTEAERTIVLAWTARGIVGNGGFRYLFQGALDARAIAAAYWTLGLEDVANAVEEAIAAFPGGAIPAGLRERQEHVARVGRDHFEAADRRVYDLAWEALLNTIAGFVSGRADVRQRFDQGDQR